MELRPLLIVVGTFTLLVGSVATAWGGDPPGNNGTVKVGGLFDDTGGNESHVGCELQVEFAGYDEGALTGTATFELIPPTGSGVLHEDWTSIGEDPAGGANDLDATLVAPLSGPIAASGVEPQALQGFHVKLTVHAEGSIGADTKHKTFWVTDCGGEGEGDDGGEGGE
jgi:hypothetical protein